MKMPYAATILDLPSEVVETILTWCAAIDEPCAIASLAQTCRQLRLVVYHTEDRHLWRLVFLAAFDDPREAHRNHADGRSTDTPILGALNFAHYDIDFDWHRAFTERVWARRYIKQHTRPVQVPKKPNLRSTRSTLLPVDQLVDEHTSSAHLDNLRALKAIVDTICTAAPCPPVAPRLAVRADGHELPPLTELHAHAPSFPPPIPTDSPSLNMDWLRRTLSNGLPYTITGTLSSEYPDLSWRHLPEAQELGRLTSYFGFIPVPVVESQTPSDSTHASRTRGTARQPSTDQSTELIDMSESAQRQRAWDCARPVAFRMRYLSRRRNWGPYLPWPPKSPKPAVTAVVDEDDADDDEEDMESDEDYVPPDDGDTSSSATPEPPEGPVVPPGEVPSPEHIYPDWAWLASARVITECKLRAHVDAADVARLENWDNLRAGAWISPPNADRDGSVEGHDEDRQWDTTDEEWKKHQHDWAGAEGTWRWVTCMTLLRLRIYHSGQATRVLAGL